MKNAGKARSYGLYRHLRTSKEIIENLLNYYYKFKRKEIMTNEKNNMYVSNFIAIGVYCWV